MPRRLNSATEANLFIRADASAAELRDHLLDAIGQGRRVASDAHMWRP